jgi:hypothetical protein
MIYEKRRLFNTRRETALIRSSPVHLFCSCIRLHSIFSGMVTLRMLYDYSVGTFPSNIIDMGVAKRYPIFLLLKRVSAQAHRRNTSCMLLVNTLDVRTYVEV